MKRDYYEILGLNRGATDDEIKNAYRKLAAKYHPDVSNDPDANAKMAEINEAYATLKNPEKRANYDEYGFYDGNNNSNYTKSYTYNYNPNSTYYDYSNGFIYRKNYSFFFKILMRMLVIFFIIQAVILLISFVSRSSTTNSNLSYRVIDISSYSLEVIGVENRSIFDYSGRNSTISINIPKEYKNRGQTYTITSIGDDAFYGFKNLQEITIPKTVKTIGSYAFYGCPSLRTIYYEGSESDFNKIIIESGNSYFKNAEKVFLESDL